MTDVVLMKFSHAFLVTICILAIIACLPAAAAAEEQTGNPEYWYNKGVDLANEGKYAEALAATDQALALNENFPRAHAMRSGLLVMVGRYEEAITEADIALASNENLTVTSFSAWANKGDALRHLGRMEEAGIAFGMAQKLDPSFIPPDTSRPPASAVPTSAKSPLTLSVVLAGLAGGCGIFRHFRWKM